MLENKVLKAQEFLASGKVKGLESIAQNLGVTPLDALDYLPKDIVVKVSGDNFLKVWEGLSRVGNLLLIFKKDGSIFEINTTLSLGRFGMGYYNILGNDAPLHGHINHQNISAIAFLTLPFMNMTTYSCTFFNKEGMEIFSICVGRDKEHKLLAKELALFKELAKEFSKEDTEEFVKDKTEENINE